ncbi:3-hydroxyacyl-CoA dehydrogenase [Oceanibaculum pacificum]|uniref:3-hydroxybutyryl-CoA dehydrogenase n=1 Tax=Oceanibaculum pacificum TaxID=580166 RepID=A0A154WFZ2_9PROT|nr:3-hydroxyacyl-CoA dehydrogenase [Oceanibaculum pacificum]KZD12375.1 3-hydroxybutyryl-CoA dehydrogenase [Oceanibaculum pacificum]
MAVSDKDFTVGVIGAGAMGQGIVQVGLEGGCKIVLHDAKPGGAEAARDLVFGRLDRLVEKGRLEADAVAAMKERLEIAADLAGMAPCQVVIEAVFEDLELKRRIFGELEKHVAADAILASNTSSLPIAAIARGCEARGRVAGMHFFNPVPLMKLVEIIKGPETEDAVAATLAELGRRMGRTPVTVKDAPGFLVNTGGRAYTTEGLRLLHEGVGTPAQIDAIMKDCCGFRMGPFELLDLTGIDVNYPVSMIVYEGYLHDPRLKTVPHHKALYEAGRLGRKTKAGFYRYDDKGGILDAPSPDHATDAAAPSTVILAEDDPRLTEFCAGLGISISEVDDGVSPILCAPIGEDATTLAARTGRDYRRLVALDLTPDISRRITIMTAPGADPAMRDAVAALVGREGRKVTAIQDSPGFVAQRIRAMVGNLSCEMAQIGLASPAEIDLAMTLGLNYPQGPLAMVDAMGVATTCRILDRLQAITGEDRYRPSLWLRRRALLGLSATMAA